MTDTAGEHEQMPDTVRMPQFLVQRIENNAQGIEQPAGHEPQNPGVRQRGELGL